MEWLNERVRESVEMTGCASGVRPCIGWAWSKMMLLYSKSKLPSRAKDVDSTLQ